MKKLHPLADSGPMNVAFLITSMPVGGAETLLVNLMRQMDPQRMVPQVICLKEKGPLGEEIAEEFTVHSDLIKHRYDVAIVPRLQKIFSEQKMDAVVTVGAGDKMFWGRLAARASSIPVIVSALHSTGWPDGVGFANRLLTSMTDAFIAVANSHGKFLVDFEKFPARKVEVISNGVDTQRFQFNSDDRQRLRQEWGWDNNVPVCGVVAALRPEKNLTLFVQAATKVRQSIGNAKFVIVGSGPEEEKLRAEANALDMSNHIRFLGSRSDVPQILSGLDMFALTSDNEASPVSILEAMSTELPVVCTNVGSVRESVLENQTGYIVPVGEVNPMSEAWVRLLSDRKTSKTFGRLARQHVVDGNSLWSMTEGYMRLLENIYTTKVNGQRYCSSSLDLLQTMPAINPAQIS